MVGAVPSMVGIVRGMVGAVPSMVGIVRGMVAVPSMVGIACGLVGAMPTSMVGIVRGMVWAVPSMVGTVRGVVGVWGSTLYGRGTNGCKSFRGRGGGLRGAFWVIDGGGGVLGVNSHISSTPAAPCATNYPEIRAFLAPQPFPFLQHHQKSHQPYHPWYCLPATPPPPSPRPD